MKDSVEGSAMAQKPLVVWGVGTTRTFRVHWMAEELGLVYETKRIEARTGETSKPGYARLNPKRKIPCLVHGDLVVSESFAIMRYLRTLSEALPHDRYQLSAAGQASYDEWASFILMELDATSLYVVRRHQDLHSIYGEAPKAVASSKEYFLRMLKAVAGQVPADAPLWGQTFSELDIMMTVALDWASLLALPLPANLAAYQRAMHQRPAYEAAREHNFRDLTLPLAPAGGST